MMRGSWPFRLLFVLGMALGLTLQGKAKEAPKTAPPATTPSRIQLPVQTKPAQPGVVPAIRPNV
ncbi:MAG: hypothetical protein ACKOS8_14635, partial [Gemmataceae bacterium]